MWWGQPLEFWQSVILWTMWGGFVLTAVGAALAVVSSFVSYQVSDVIQAEADKRIAAAEQSSLAANTEAAKANEAAAHAQERAALLEKQAADARLETEKLKQAVAWRSISADQVTTLRRALSATTGAVNLRYMDGDPEALAFAVQLSHVLAAAGWQVASGAWKPSNTILFGLFIPDSTGNGQRLRQALTSANLAFSSEPLPDSGTWFNVTTITGAPILMVGSRRPVLP